MDPFEEKPIQNPNGPERGPGNESYVYPNQNYSWQPPAPGGQPPAGKPPSKNSATRIVGFAALVMAAIVIFSAITGGIVFTYMKNQNQPATTAEAGQTTQTAATTQPTAGTTASSSPSGSVTDKFWSIADAATRSDSDRKALSIMDIAAQGKPAVVAINTEVSMTDLFGNTGKYQAAGSGFIITGDGYIVTNNHVIAGASVITVVLDSGEIYDAELVGADSQNDVAVIKISGSDFPTVYLGDSDDLVVGELAVAIGNPLGELSGTVTAGIISALDRQITIDDETLNLLQTDAAINSGNSGGALFNSFGEVIAINTAKSGGENVEGLGFAIPINDAKPIIESLIQNGYVTGRTKIGIITQDINAQMADHYKIPEGIYIYEVEPRSAADKAGLQAEDIIIAVDGQEVLTTDKLKEIKNNLKPGDVIALTIVREGEEMEILVTLEEDIPSNITPASASQQPDYI